MDEIRQDTQKEPRRKRRLRITAGILTAALVLSVGANAAIGIKIEAGDRAEAAANYLVENTDYVQNGRIKRLQQKGGSLGDPETLEDYYRLAGTQIAEMKYQEALDSIRSCLKLYPGGDRPLYVDLLMKEGCLLVLLDRGDEALETLDLALKQKPELSDAYLVKAQIYAERGEAAPLADTLQAYLELEPEDYEIRGVLAQALTTESDYQDAADQYQQVLDHAEEGQDITETALLHALTNIQIGRFDVAEKSLRIVEEKAPDTEGLSYYIGVCQMSRGDYDGAIGSMTAAIEQNSMIQLSSYSRGVCRLMVNDQSTAAAEKDLKKAAAYTGDDRDLSVAQQAQSLLDEVASAKREAQRLAQEEQARRAAAEQAAAEAAAAAAQAAKPIENAETPADADLPLTDAAAGADPSEEVKTETGAEEPDPGVVPPDPEPSEAAAADDTDLQTQV